jgi:hypothetical protein
MENGEKDYFFKIKEPRKNLELLNPRRGEKM